MAERILGLLAMAYGMAVPEWVMPKLRNAAEKWNSGKQGRATLLLIHMGLRDLTDDAEGLDRLDMMEKAFDRGEVPSGFVYECKQATFNPDEPRDARGRWTTGGASARSGSSIQANPTRRSPYFMPAADHPGSDAATAPTQGNSGLDVGAAVQHLDDHAHARSQHQCATYVENAIAAGGVNVPKGPIDAKDKGPALLAAGFASVPASGYSPQPGDVAVIQSYPGGNPSGHMAMWNGDQWVSDFRQNHGTSPYPGPGYLAAQPSVFYYRP